MKEKDDNNQLTLGIVPCNIEEEMKRSYIDYSMSVIVGRALPDVRDGLKPVHRRILYAMKELGLVHNKAYKKSAAVVGDVLGKYHPHGDMAVYDAMVRMAQDFSLRYMLVDGQGNFGSVDGDSAAAYRYTEVRLSVLAEELLKDIDKDTVDFMPNFDGSKQEPKVLPGMLPNLLINGSSGIAVAMATNIPPHNISEVIEGLLSLIDNSEITIADLNKIIKGPDFPGGCSICGTSGIHKAYSTGRGSIKIRAKCNIEDGNVNRKRIIVTEIPYQVNKSSLLEGIANLVKDKKIHGISDLRDESNRKGMRIVIDLKKDANPDIVLNNLYKHTQLETGFGIIMLALVDKRPKVLTLKEVLNYYLEHRLDVVTRRLTFELNKAEERAHILEGLRLAIENLDEVVRIIRKSKNADEAKEKLVKKFEFSKKQVQAILDMRLHQLTTLEREELEKEYLDLIKFIEKTKDILSSKKKIMLIIKHELIELQKKYGDKRRTTIEHVVDDINIEDLIKREKVVITLSNTGYIKRIPVDTYRSQARGGRGITGMVTKEGDFVENIIVTSTHSYILFFSNLGRVYWLRAYEVPDSSRVSRGKAIINLLNLSKSGEKITAVIPVKKFIENVYLFMATKFGNVKKTSLKDYSSLRKTGINAIGLREGDNLVDVKLTSGKNNVVLASYNGMAIKFKEKDVRPMGRTAKGVRGIRLNKDDFVIGMEIVEENGSFFVATENGYGKRTNIKEYREINRGGKGVKNIKTSDRNGKVVGVKTVNTGDEIMLITQKGIIIRQPAKGIRVIGRATQGVRLIKIQEADKLVSIARIQPEEEA